MRSTVEDRTADVDTNRLYEATLKALLVEYINESRFFRAQPARSSDSAREQQLPLLFCDELKTRLHAVAMEKSHGNDLTRRLLLRFYSDMLAPGARFASVDVLVMRFVSAANKEVTKVPSPGAGSALVLEHTRAFIRICIQTCKNADLAARFSEHMAALDPAQVRESRTRTYVQPSFDLADMDQLHVAFVCKLFAKSATTLQADVTRLKYHVSHKTLHKDLDHTLFYIGKDLGKFAPTHFASPAAYAQWKLRETAMCAHLRKKYPLSPEHRLLPTPDLPQGCEFYVMPSVHAIQPFYTALVKLCLAAHRAHAREDALLFSNKSKDLLSLTARLWRVDFPSRAVALYSAAHAAGLLKDPLFAADARDLGPIDIASTANVLQTCRRIVEDAKLDWDDKHLWLLRDQAEWATALSHTYSEVFYAIRDSLSVVVSAVARPKFGPYLQFLGEYVESDVLFEKVAESGIAAKWEKRLSRALLKASEALYADALASLPRDDTLNIGHVLDIADTLTNTIKLLQKRYKTPLLGIINISRTYATVVTGMFALDSKNILKHIVAHAKSRGEFLNYADALEVYKSLKEIRSIHLQLSDTKFPFDLEKFFYPHLEAWALESRDKIREVVQNAIRVDSYEPLDIADDTKKFSSSVFDIFAFVQLYMDIVRGLEWLNAYQLAKIHTVLVRAVSACAQLYACEMMELVVRELNSLKPEQPEAGGWLADVRSLVDKYKINVEVESVNFTSKVCVGLNNVAAMTQRMAVLEELLDCERVASIVAKHERKSVAYSSHVFSIRVLRAEELACDAAYLTLNDTLARRTIAKTRPVDGTAPVWDEEFEVTIPADSSLTLSATVWDGRPSTHSVCGRALVQLEPQKFQHDGIPQEVVLELDPQGRVTIDVAVESEREDALFAMGKAHRALKRTQQRIVQLLVAKFTDFIQSTMLQQTLRTVCGSSGNVKPTRAQLDEAMMPLYNYLNMNLLVLAQYLTKDLLLQVMVEAWNVVVASADALLLPQLTSSRALKHKATTKWLAVTSAVANVTGSIGALGIGKTLTNNEIETVIAWLNFLCIDFFHNEGAGPPIEELKSQQYQSLLLIPVYHDNDVEFLHSEVERLAPAYLQLLRDKNNVLNTGTAALRSRAGSIARSLTIKANATAKARAAAAQEARLLLSDPLAAQTAAEDIILRLLLVRDERQFVASRLEQRERLAHTIATERLARAAAEGF